MLRSSIGYLRLIGLAEGLSYIVLLLIAMPLKYLAGLPAMVKYVGWVHGLLFMLYIAAVAVVAIYHDWSFRRVFRALVASVIPFGTFVLDRELREETKQVA